MMRKKKIFYGFVIFITLIIVGIFFYISNRFINIPSSNIIFTTDKNEYEVKKPIIITFQNNNDYELCLNTFDFLIIEAYLDSSWWGMIHSLPEVHNHCFKDSNGNKIFNELPECLNISPKSSIEIFRNTDEYYCELGSGLLYRFKQDIDESSIYSNEFTVR